MVAVLFAGCTGGSEANEAPKVGKIIATVSGNKATLSSAATDPNGDPLTFYWAWDLGTKTTQTNRTEIEFPAGATKDVYYRVGLVVRDGKGGAAAAEGYIRFGQDSNQAPAIKLKDTARWVDPTAQVSLNASATYDTNKDKVSYEWIWGPRNAFKEVVAQAQNAADPPITDVQAFHSGLLLLGQSYNQTMDQPGTFTVHCHPHPYMKMRIIVDPALPAAPAKVKIENYAFPAELKVGKGSVLQFTNLDPAPHTATVLDYTPGANSGGTQSVFTKKFDKGEYVVRLIARDPKGSYATQTWGVKVSDDAPKAERPVVPTQGPRTTADDAAVVLFNSSQMTVNNKVVRFKTNMSATFLYEDPLDQGGSMSATFEALGPDGGSAGDCYVQRVGTLKKYTMDCVVPGDPGEYKFSFKPQFYVTKWNFTSNTLAYAFPPFGDSGGDGHNHTH